LLFGGLRRSGRETPFCRAFIELPKIIRARRVCS
jgi:hypothetical protein